MKPLKYDELTEEQQKKVSLMYSDKDTVSQYLYNFDDNGDYHGRQYNPPEGETKEGIHFGRLHIGMDEKKEEVKEEKPVEEVKPAKKVVSKNKKK